MQSTSAMVTLPTRTSCRRAHLVPPPSAPAGARRRDADRSVALRRFEGKDYFGNPVHYLTVTGKLTINALADRRASAAGSDRCRRERAVDRDARIARGRRRCSRLFSSLSTRRTRSPTTAFATTRFSRSSATVRCSRPRWTDLADLWRVRIPRRRFRRLDARARRVRDAQGRLPGLRAPRDRVLAQYRTRRALRGARTAHARGQGEARRCGCVALGLVPERRRSTSIQPIT